MTELTCSFRYKKSPPVLEVNCIQKISDRFHIYIVELGLSVFIAQRDHFIASEKRPVS